LVSWQVGSAEEARAAVGAGCDQVVAQGTEVGGHVRGRMSLLPLLSEVLDAVDVPVLAEGGIGDARALAAVLAAGADGARIGTRFVAARESGAHPRYVDALIAARPEDTDRRGDRARLDVRRRHEDERRAGAGASPVGDDTEGEDHRSHRSDGGAAALLWR
jgi:NAD(P)H-dependent flavin oxidoreductase YrpB (nitropropane dioxygenase family)